MGGTSGRLPRRPRNDPAQYDDLQHLWWDPRGGFAMLHWLAKARAALVPPPRRPHALLLDIACGGGLLAPHLPAGYRHVGVDLSEPALLAAAQHGVLAVRADALSLPFRDGCADVVVAGEVLEHVPDLARAVQECCRVLAPGGTLVIDTIAATRLARFVAVTVGERIPGGPPKRLHDHRLFVDRQELVELCRARGVHLRLNGLRPSPLGYLAWLLRLRDTARMVPSRSTAVLFAAVGTKAQLDHDSAPKTTL